MINRKALTTFSVVDDCSVSNCCDNTLEASSTPGSFIMIKACRGVLVLRRFTSHWSRLLASNNIMRGGGTVSLMNVYIPLRYNAFPWSCLYVASTPRPEVAASQMPLG